MSRALTRTTRWLSGGFTVAALFAIVLAVTLLTPERTSAVSAGGGDLTGLSGSFEVELAADPPVADAGPDQTVDATSNDGAMISFDGRGSANAVAYRWLVDGTQIGTTHSLNYQLPIGITVVTLEITNADLVTDTDDVTVTVMPVANAGPDIHVVATTAMGAYPTLNGTASFGTVVSWSVAGGAVIGTQPIIQGLFFPIFVTEVTLTVSGPGGLIDTDTVLVTVDPKANAGPDAIYNADTPTSGTAQLDGSASFASSQAIYRWTDSANNNVATGVTASVSGVPLGAHTFTLTITDVYGQTSSDTVVITIVYIDANADATQRSWPTETLAGAIVTLDGSLSVQGADVYQWWRGCDEPTCAPEDLLVAGDASMQIADVHLPLGNHPINLWVFYEGGWYYSDTIFVSVTPNPDAGSDQIVAAPNGVDAAVTLNASGTIGAEYYVWRQGDEEIAWDETAVVTLPIGTHLIELEAGIIDINSASDWVTITVVGPPTANAGPDQSLKAQASNGATVTLDGSASAPGGTATTITTWQWSIGGQPLASGETTSALVPIGSTTVTLTVTDSLGMTSTDTVLINVTVPVANAGEDITLTANSSGGTSVSLYGRDSIGSIASYQWSTVDDPDLATGSAPNVYFPIGVHVVTLTVTGTNNQTDSDTVTVTILPANVPIETALTPTRTPVGGTVSFTLGNFPPLTPVTAWIESFGAEIELTTVTTNVSGAATGTITIPEVQGGDALIQFRYGAGEEEAAAIEIAPTIRITPAVTKPGATVTASVAGFRAGESAAIRWRVDSKFTRGLATITVGPNGSGEVTLQVPGNAGRGLNSVRAESPSFNAQTNNVMLLIPELRLEPARATVGSTVTFEIDNLTTLTDVTLSIHASGTVIDLGRVQTDGTGSATGSFVVPEVQGGITVVGFEYDDVLRDDGAVLEIAPRIRIEPSNVRPGRDVTATVTGFRAGEIADIRWRINGSFTSVEKVTVGANGSATITFPAPLTVQSGQNVIRADSPSFAAQTSAVTVIAPDVLMDPTRTTVGASVYFKVSDFDPNETLTVTWRRPGGSSVGVATVQTDATGSADGTFTVPATEGGDANRVSFETTNTRRVLPFDVAPRIKITPASVSPGQQVDVSLRGFGKQETVEIRWRVQGVWQTIATVTTSNTGSANVLVTVPANADPGQNSVRADGTKFRQQTNAVTVVP